MTIVKANLYYLSGTYALLLCPMVPMLSTVIFGAAPAAFDSFKREIFLSVNLRLFNEKCSSISSSVRFSVSGKILKATMSLK